MIFCSRPGSLVRQSKARNRIVLFFLLALQIFPTTSFALPKRLIICLDGIAYRDLQARYPNILGSYDVNVQRADVLDHADWLDARLIR